jgi:hypothetical protein
MTKKEIDEIFHPIDPLGILIFVISVVSLLIITILLKHNII